MVDALKEAHRVLSRTGVLVDLRPVIVPIVVEVVVANDARWATSVETYSAPEDVAAAEAATQHALSREWFRKDASLHFDLEIYCDTAADLSAYAEGRKLEGAPIPFDELEGRRREWSTEEPARLRCLRRWMLSTYRKTSR